jgi:geranylgeranyl pyrophosphate synthase
MEEVKKILAEIKPHIDAYIAKVIPDKGNPQVLFDGSWEYFKYGGKRFRPALVALSCEALGGKVEDTIAAGAALEIAHTFLLIHDDIEDNSEMRRGQPALHKKYGIPHAVNMGDYLMMKMYDSIVSGKDIWGPEKTIKILDMFTQMLMRTGEGQAFEIDQRDRDLSEATMEWYETMSAHKTGYYTGGYPCAVGGLIGNGTEEQIKAFLDLGIAVGVAFQIQDDIIDVTMKPEEENIAPGTTGGGHGKKFAEDLKEGKRTLLVVHAFQSANDEEKETLRKLIGNPNITHEEKLQVIEVMKKYDSLNFAKKYARDLLEKGLTQLKEKIPETEGRNKLEAMAEFLIKRTY